MPRTNYWKTLYDRHRLVWVGMFCALMLAVGLVAAVIPKAFAQCTTNPDMTCAVSPKRAARLFRDGHYHRADGIQMHKTFARPYRAGSVVRAKFVRYYRHASAAKRRAMRHRYGVTRSSVAARGVSCFGWSVAQCVAGRMWHSLTTNVSCSSYDPYPNTNAGSCVTWSATRQGITKDEVQKGGQVGFCAGNAILAVRAATDSPTGPGALFFAGWGTAMCTWSAWSLFD